MTPEQIQTAAEQLKQIAASYAEQIDAMRAALAKMQAACDELADEVIKRLKTAQKLADAHLETQWKLQDILAEYKKRESDAADWWKTGGDGNRDA